MRTAVAARFPLITRRPDEVVAWHGRVSIKVADLLADVAALAGRLPDRPRFINACQERYAALVAFLACVARGRACLLPGGQASPQLAALRRDHPDTVVLTDGPEADHGGAAIHVAILTGAGVPDAVPDIDPAQIACLAFTSGTTGRPVPHPRHWGTLMRQMEATARRFELAGAETVSVVATVPHGHMFGFETTILLPLRANVAIHVGTPLYPDDVRAALEAVPMPRVLVTSPVHLRALSAGTRPLPTLRSVISATAPLAGEVAERVERQFATEVLEIYGCTEAGTVGTRRTVDGPDWTILDGLSLEAPPELGAGAASVRLPHAPRPLVLHDVITLLGDRRFRLVGRREDMIKVGGKRGSLAGLTAILLGIEGVRDGVFVMPDGADDNDAVRPVVIVAAPELAPKMIVDELRRRIDPAFVPRRVIMTEALPRDPLGKLPRARIAALLAGSADTDPDAT